MEFNIKLSRKLEDFCSSSCLSQQEISKRNKICQGVQENLKLYYPDCQVFIYGSTLNGYGTRTSDLDLLFLPCPDYKNDNSKTVNKNEKKDIVTPSLQDVDSDVFPKEDLLNMDATMQLSFVRKVLRHKKIYHKVMYVQAKVPIVHFESSYLKISCDISCGSRQVLYNTQLLKFFSVLDSRVQPLVMILRHWAKSLNIIQSGVLSSYAFTLIVIFFLQNTDPPVLPPVIHLCELSESINIVEDWNASFTTDLDKIKKSENTKSLGELLKEFFMYYRTFNFASCVVSVHSGHKLSIHSLVEDENLKNFEVTPLCVQDPFILSLNVGRHMHRKALISFQQGLYLASKIIEEMEHCNSLNNFELLLNKKEYEKLMKNLLKPSISEEAFFFTVDFNGEVLKLLERDDKLRKNLYQSASSALYELLQFGLLIDCEIIDKNVIFYEHAFDQHENTIKYNHFLTIQCTLYDLSYVGRGKVKELPSVDCDFEQFSNMIVRKEYIISNHLLQKNPLLHSPEPRFQFLCECYQSRFDYMQSIAIVLTPLTEFKASKQLFRFLFLFVQKNLPKMLFEVETLTCLSNGSNGTSSAPENGSIKADPDAPIFVSSIPSCNQEG